MKSATPKGNGNGNGNGTEIEALGIYIVGRPRYKSQLARIMKVNVRTVRRWIANERHPSAEKCRRIAALALHSRYMRLHTVDHNYDGLIQNISSPILREILAVAENLDETTGKSTDI